MNEKPEFTIYDAITMTSFLLMCFGVFRLIINLFTGGDELINVSATLQLFLGNYLWNENRKDRK